MRRTTIALVLAPLLAASAGAPARAAAAPGWQPLTTGVAANLRALDAVDAAVAWTGGSGGTVLRTTDAGATWRDVSPPGAADLEFRDIEATDAQTAVALAVGAGDKSRVLRTTDGGATWAETFRGTEGAAFYNCLAFFDADRGLAVSDPVDGAFRLISTADGGRTWSVLPQGPAAAAGEYSFANDGNCLVAPGAAAPGTAVFGTGGGASHYHVTTDYGTTWQRTPSGFPTAEYGGVFSLAFRDGRGAAVGGDLRAPASAAARSTDGGRSWQAAGTPPSGFRASVAWVDAATLVAVGPSGTDLSSDGGATWAGFAADALLSVSCAPAGRCLAVGDSGTAAALNLDR